MITNALKLPLSYTVEYNVIKNNANNSELHMSIIIKFRGTGVISEGLAAMLIQQVLASDIRIIDLVKGLKGYYESNCANIPEYYSKYEESNKGLNLDVSAIRTFNGDGIVFKIHTNKVNLQQHDFYKQLRKRLIKGRG